MPARIASLGTAQAQGTAVQDDATGPDRLVTGEGEGQFGASGTHQPRQGHDLTGADLQVDVPYVVGGDTLQTQDDLLPGDVLPYEQGGQVTADHHADHLALVRVTGLQDTGDRAVAQDGDPVRETEDLLHAVGDVDDGDALRPQTVDEGEEGLRLVLGQRGSRLVEGDDLGLAGEGPQDLHQLALCRVELRAQLIGVDDLPETQPGQVGGDAAAQLGPVETASGLPGQGSGVHVLGDRDVRDDLRFLGNDVDPGPAGLVR